MILKARFRVFPAQLEERSCSKMSAPSPRSLICCGSPNESGRKKQDQRRSSAARIPNFAMVLSHCRSPGRHRPGRTRIMALSDVVRFGGGGDQVAGLLGVL